MKSSLDCISCFIRQTLEAARMVTPNTADHETILKTVLYWAATMDLSQPPPVMGQQIHRYLREITGQTDPYRDAKKHQNQMAFDLLPWLQANADLIIVKGQGNYETLSEEPANMNLSRADTVLLCDDLNSMTREQTMRW